LSATSPVDGTFVYTPAAGAVLNAGVGQALSVTFTPKDIANYNPASKTVTITVLKAPQTIIVTAPPPASALYNTTFTVAAIGGASGNPITFGAAGSCTNQGAMFTVTSGYGTCTVTFNQAGNGNYDAAIAVSQTVSMTPWQVRGFYAPVTSSVGGTPVWNVVKGGSTVPLKFQIFAGATEQTALTAVPSMNLQKVPCTGGAADVLEQLVDTGGTALRYDGTQFIQNWKTPTTKGVCYLVTMTAADTTTITAYFQLK
jgi:hypothetical protein